ncbi:MAG: hypothetical protein EA425_10570 [Puniceicoccaceae bacterium]|nr:MAG: hypothetical protein EA425_10570 [Puniceicoccaceae bacterium]
MHLIRLTLLAAFSGLSFALPPLLFAGGNLAPAGTHAWSPNSGWIHGLSGDARGAACGLFYLQGHCWSANTGWVSLGKGQPANGYAYSNTSGADSGVNLAGSNPDGTARLRGLAWSANTGWIVFEDEGNPRLNLLTGWMGGYAWSPNLGWINLGEGFAGFNALNLSTGPDEDNDGIPDAYEWQVAGNLHTLGTGDYDGDGMSDLDEYGAGTDPLDPTSNLRVIHITADVANEQFEIGFTSVPLRVYRILHSPAPGSSVAWTDVGLGPFVADPGMTTARSFLLVAGDRGFFKVEARPPLAP